MKTKFFKKDTLFLKMFYIQDCSVTIQNVAKGCVISPRMFCENIFEKLTQPSSNNEFFTRNICVAISN